ncbi:MAG: heavy-metal-associated domain-containing protein [Bacteroidetes bacterium]|nr:heavy-metal-associated domain-containing protein [Bacteroidota bacterium]
MTSSIIYKFRVSGMHDSEAVASVRDNLSTIAGVGAISVNLRKMQVEVIAHLPIDAAVWRKALAGTDFTMSELTTSIKRPPPDIRDDSAGEY